MPSSQQRLDRTRCGQLSISNTKSQEPSFLPVAWELWDGCFRMNMNEIATAVRCGRPLIEIVLNNHVLGMVRQWQTLFYDHRYSHTILNDAVDFVKLAEAMGAKAIRITKMEEVEPALKEALACPGPIVLDCMIDQDLSVFPMVPAGASIDDIFDEEDMKNNEQSV